MTPEQLGLDLRTDAEREMADRLALFRKHMDQDWRNPGRHTRIRYGDGSVHKGTRCLRCGKPIRSYDRIINHDCGWCGCYAVDGHRQFKDAAEMNAGRAESAAFPACARCQHAWGLHATRVAWPPGLAGHDGYCYTWCGCQRYIRPPGALTPWGTCPGCWAKPPAECWCVQ